MVLESASIVKNWFSYNSQLVLLNDISYNVVTSRLTLDVPHAVLSFMVNNSNNYNINVCIKDNSHCIPFPRVYFIGQ